MVSVCEQCENDVVVDPLRTPTVTVGSTVVLVLCEDCAEELGVYCHVVSDE